MSECRLPAVCEGVAIWSIKLDMLPSFGSQSKFSRQESPFLDVLKNRRYPSVWNALDTILPPDLEVNYVTLSFSPRIFRKMVCFLNTDAKSG